MRLTRHDLWSLEAYAEQRPHFRAQVMSHKRLRTLHLGDHLTLLFEDRTTILYQVQEMLRIERIFEAQAIEDELAAYNPLIPDGGNWKATLLIEYPDSHQRAERLRQLCGVATRITLQVEGFPAIEPVSDEDLPRETAEKTSAVHFLRYEVPLVQCQALRQGAQLAAAVDHPAYAAAAVWVPEDLRLSLLGDLLG